MEKVKEVERYIPVAQSMHYLLLQLYNAAMTTSPEESKKWCEILRGVLEGWRSMKTDGMLPGFLVSNFHKDITHVIGIVHNKVKIEELSEHQKMFTFNMATLRNEFDGR